MYKKRLAVVCALSAGWLASCGSAEDEETISQKKQTAQAAPEVISAAERGRREEMIRAHFREVVSKREIVATTVTPKGQIIDWVPAPVDDEDWKNPPPPPDGDEADDEGSFFKTEVQMDPSLRGPDNTVPYVRFDVERYLASVDVPPSRIDQIWPMPTPEGNPETCILGTESSCVRYYTKVTYEGGYGTAATLNVWDNNVESSEATISQIGTLWRDPNNDDKPRETMEVGVVQYGGTPDPQLFIFYTNKSYGQFGSCGTNYVQFEDPYPPCTEPYCPNSNPPVAWMQLSATVTSGMALDSSTMGGQQIDGRVIAQRVKNGPNSGDFRVWVNGVLVGRFVTECFPQLKVAPSSEIEQIWQGEVAVLPGGAATTTNMGSGVAPSGSPGGFSDYGYVAYARDLGYYKGSATGEYPYQRYSGSQLTGHITDSACYNLWYYECPSCVSGWRNYVLFGGPGSEAAGCN